MSQLAIPDHRIHPKFLFPCKKAAAVWLDYGMHRCRIVVAMMDAPSIRSVSQAEMMQRLKSGDVTLTASPLLGRFGNVKGAELESLTTIDKGIKHVIRMP